MLADHACHVCYQDPLGPDCRCFLNRTRHGLGRDGVDGLAAGLSASAWRTVVHARGFSLLLPASLLLVVVRLWRLRTIDLCRGRLYRRLWRLHRDCGGHRHVAVADPRSQEYHYRSEEHTSELQSLMRTSYSVLC